VGVIFISYRRDDSKTLCDRITDKLRDAFGPGKVYRDIESPKGVDYRRSIDDGLDQASVALVVIGPQWASVVGADGRPRLTDPADAVRIEIETALLRRIPIMPILINDTRMPAVAEVPPSLSQLVYIQAHRVREDPDFRSDMEAVIKGIAYYLPTTPMGAGAVNELMATARPMLTRATPVVKTLFTVGAVIMMIFGLAWTAGGLGFALLSIAGSDGPGVFGAIIGVAITLLGVATFTGAIFLLRAARRR
jgi:TIR domain-containing protein